MVALGSPLSPARHAPAIAIEHAPGCTLANGARWKNRASDRRLAPLARGPRPRPPARSRAPAILNPDLGGQQPINLTPSRDCIPTCGKLPTCAVQLKSKYRSGSGLKRVAFGSSLWMCANA